MRNKHGTIKAASRVEKLRPNSEGTMSTQTTTKAKRTTRDSLFTTLWGWFTAPKFGSAGSGGLEYEPFPRWTSEFAVRAPR